MLRRAGGCCLAAAGIALAAIGCSGASDAPGPPRLVTVVVVDQMRADFLERFGGRYDSGLARLTAEGVRFDDAHQDHANTVTAAGHATVSTGRFPSANGIVGNGWWSREAARQVYCVEDETVTPVGLSADASPGGGRSPANLLSDTVGDWLKGVSPDSKVFSVAIKDRSAILLGGRRPDGAFWFSGTGRFVTSSYYAEALPEWLQKLNASGRADRWFGNGWDRLDGAGEYAESRADAFAAEADGERTTFPHRFDGDEIGPDYYSALRTSPFGDRLTLEVATRLVQAERLGEDPTPDLLMIGLSSADSIGHVFGPYSQEIQDYYLRLDRMLGELLDFLDERVGPGNHVLVLTSDHGVLPMPEELVARGVEASRTGPGEVFSQVGAALAQAAADLGLEQEIRPERVSGGLVLRAEGDALTTEEARGLRERVAADLRGLSAFADVFTHDELLDPGTPERPYLETYRRSFHPDRAADLTVRLAENTLFTSRPVGTTHGSPYRYDTHVPLLFHGGGIPASRVERRVRTVDIGPTLIRLLGATPPAGLDGQDLGDDLGRPGS